MRELSGQDAGQLTIPYAENVPLPPDCEQTLRPDNPRLAELRRAYAALDLPAITHSHWTPGNVDGYLDLRYFRGDSMIQWHYRELPRSTRLKMFIYLAYVAERDGSGLLEHLDEDGQFGCWTYEFSGRPTVSRDLLESVNELLFLQRQLSLLERTQLRVIDIGAGYGRLAHRMTAATSALADYCCVDAIPEASFLCDYYLRFRGSAPPARVVGLHEIDSLTPGEFDLAINIHSFSECTFGAVQWWLERLGTWGVPLLFLIPNEPDGIRSLEVDGSRRDLTPALTAAGYRLTVREPVIEDEAVRAMLRLHDHFHIFELTS